MSERSDFPPLPTDHRPYTDAYFLHSSRILAAEGVNPLVTVRVFIRRGPGVVRGLDEALRILVKYGGLDSPRARVWAVPEGGRYAPLETLMLITAPLLDIIELETMYLGAITARTTLANSGPPPDLDRVRERAKRISGLAKDRPCLYFGARHWHWSRDAEICTAACQGGFAGCATAAGAEAAGLGSASGTIPHALVLAMAWARSREHAAREAVLAFDRHMPPSHPRIALADTFNREIDDSLDVADALGDRLYGVRIDTAGELVGQGGAPFDGRTHVTGPGVTVASVAAVRQALDRAGRGDVRIFLTSGFGTPDKVNAFVDAEARHGRLFDGLGIGGLFPARISTADVVRIEDVDFAKTGRGMVDNPALIQVA